MRDPPSEQTAVQRTLQQGLQHGRTCLKMVSGRPGGFGSSAMPKTRQQCFDLQTQAPGGRPNLSQISFVRIGVEALLAGSGG